MTDFTVGKLRSLFAGLAFALAGCGSGEPTLHPITGTVTLDGQPIPEGRITFRPLSGPGQSFSGAITAGAYEVNAEPGEMAVEVIATRLIPGKFDTTSNPGSKDPVGEMYIPKKYNSETTLKATVVTGPNSFPFELTSKK